VLERSSVPGRCGEGREMVYLSRMACRTGGAGGRHPGARGGGNGGRSSAGAGAGRIAASTVAVPAIGSEPTCSSGLGPNLWDALVGPTIMGPLMGTTALGLASPASGLAASACMSLAPGTQHKATRRGRQLGSQRRQSRAAPAGDAAVP
jgi:hypothetical protein